MLLSELAALAAERVPGFVRPFAFRYFVGGSHVTGWDDSPAALLMAVVVWLHANRYGFMVEHGDVAAYTATDPDGGECLHDGTPESIARAAVVALLRAHGVEVSDA